MGSFGGFYKGEKKKSKKDRQAKGGFNSVPITMPVIVSKNKKNY
jgi:hypothetical protein